MSRVWCHRCLETSGPLRAAAPLCTQSLLLLVTDFQGRLNTRPVTERNWEWTPLQTRCSAQSDAHLMGVSSGACMRSSATVVGGHLACKVCQAPHAILHLHAVVSQLRTQCLHQPAANISLPKLEWDTMRVVT